MGALSPFSMAPEAYSPEMAQRASLADKTRTIQGRLIALGHKLPRFGADGDFGHETADVLLAHFAVKPPVPLVPKIGIAASAFALAAEDLGCSVAQIRAVDEVESGGGWFTDVRASILDLDGPGGFIDGPELPKILFEAHQFSKRTEGLFDDSHPNLSSPKWNRALYVGGEGEWARLHRAMQLDEGAALRSASVGRYQIMGFNHRLAGFDTVRGFWDAMKESETRQLGAFVAFIKASKLLPQLRRISAETEDCAPFALAYNGPGYRANGYDRKLAVAFRKFSRKA